MDVFLFDRTKRQKSKEASEFVIRVIIVASHSVRVAIVSHITDDLKHLVGELIIVELARSFRNSFQIGEGRPKWNLDKARFSRGDRARVVFGIKKPRLVQSVKVLFGLRAPS